MRWATVPRVSRRVTIVALLGSALALGSCGEDDGSRDGLLSAAEYRTQLTRLCEDSAAEASRIGGVQGANAAAFAEYFDRLAALATRRMRQFEGLRPPADLRDEQSKLTRLVGDGVDAIEQAAAGFRSGVDPAPTFRSFRTTYNRSLRERNEVVMKLKVPKCEEAQLGASAGAAQGSS